MAVETAVTCNDCAYYNVRSGSCLEWGGPVKPSDLCGRFIACDGSGRLQETKRQKPEVKTVAKEKPERHYSGLTVERVAELIITGKKPKEIAEEYGVTYSTVSSHINRALKTGLMVRTGYAKYAAPGSEPEEPETSVEPEDAQDDSWLLALEDELAKIGEWILDFDSRLRKVETRLADGLEGIADKLGAMQGSMIALRQAHIVTSQSVGGIKEQLEQTRLASPDYTDRLLTILETQQAIMADMARGRDDADQS